MVFPGIASALPGVGKALGGGNKTKVNVSQASASELVASVNPVIGISIGGGSQSGFDAGGGSTGGGASAPSAATANDAPPSPLSYLPQRSGRLGVDVPPARAAHVADAISGGGGLFGNVSPITMLLIAGAAGLLIFSKGKGR